MKRLKNKVIGIITAMAMMTTSIICTPVNTIAESKILASGVWYESIYVEWAKVDNAQGYNAYYKQSADTAYQRIDDELVRGDSEGNGRVDVLGLKGGTSYDVKVVPVISGNEAEDKAILYTAVPKADNRDGYGFYNTSNAPGAYNMDGTLGDADIIYVNDNNKDSVTLNGYSGLSGILSKGARGKATKPLVVRVTGTLNIPSGVTGDVMLGIYEGGPGITVEGVGTDAGLYGWGFTLKGAKDIEFKNLQFHWYPEDALGFESCSRLWIHNNDFKIGHNDNDNTAEQDKGNGDGSCDLRACNYVTVSYNHFNNCDKTSLIGSSATSRESTGNLTFHHNMFEGTNARTPRVRWHNIHVYNNYYKGVTGYGIGAACNSNIFAEANYFENTARPMITSGQGNDGGKMSNNDGGVIKAYGNVMDNCTYNTPNVDYYVAENRDYQMGGTDFTTKLGGWTYNNFDTSSTGFYKDSYNVDTAVNAKTEVMSNAGRMEGGVLELTLNTDKLFEGEPTAQYYYDSPASGSTGKQFGGTDGSGTFFEASEAGYNCSSGNANVTIDGEEKSLNGYFTFGNGKLIYFTVSEPAVLTVVSSTSNSTGRAIKVKMLNNGSYGDIAGGSFSTGSGNKANVQQIKLSEAGSYAINNVGGGGANIYYLGIDEYGEDGRVTTESTTVTDTSTEFTTEASTEVTTHISTETSTAISSETTTEITTETTTETVTETETNDDGIKYGDANDDGILTAEDCAIVLQYVLNKSSIPGVDERWLRRCDVSGDGEITAEDASYILQKVLNNSFKMPIEIK